MRRPNGRRCPAGQGDARPAVTTIGQIVHGATNDRALGAARRTRPALNVNVAELSEVVAAAPESMVVSGGVGSARATTLLGAYQ